MPALEKIFKRGAIFFDPKYDRLDDPDLQGQTKGKFFVVVSNSPADDPIVHLLTTSEKPKHAGKPYMFRIPAGTYAFLSKDTLIDVSVAGSDASEIESATFRTVYEDGQIYYKGQLSDADVAALIKAIEQCPVVDKRYKMTLHPPAGH